MSDTTAYLLTLACPDAPGIVAAVANGIAGLGGNILSNAQFSEPSIERFCMRMRYEAPTQDPDGMAATLREGLPVDDDIELVVHEADFRTPTLLMVSKYDHCLRDLLYRWHAGELPVDIRMVVSNHWDLQEVAANYHVPFVHVPVTKDTKAAAEARLLELVDEHDVELVVLARYMQILSDDLCRQLEGRIINIHHSFLPGFKGARPYHQAWERGVKVIGATAHYVTADLDEGPIIHQDVMHVSHEDDVSDLVRLGRDLEKTVLAKALWWHVRDRVLVFKNKTLVFD